MSPHKGSNDSFLPLLSPSSSPLFFLPLLIFLSNGRQVRVGVRAERLSPCIRVYRSSASIFAYTCVMCAIVFISGIGFLLFFTVKRHHPLLQFGDVCRSDGFRESILHPGIHPLYTYIAVCTYIHPLYMTQCIYMYTYTSEYL